MKIIAIAGNATCGKDRLYELLCLELQGRIKCKRIGFADALKEELNTFLLSQTGISAWTTNAEEKRVIRSMLVFWGNTFRRGQDPNYWVNQVARQVQSCQEETCWIIPDLRYKNEYDWIKSQGGITIFLNRQLSSSTVVPPANEYEKENNMLLAQICDLNVTWKSYRPEESHAQRTWVKDEVLTHLEYPLFYE
jgi:hypothetical protein